jgi:hypothetical protein
VTAVAIWLSDEVAERPSLEAAADTQVSVRGVRTLISDASKVLPLSVACLSPSPDSESPPKVSRHTYGYAFAGSTLLGQNTYLSLSALLENLIATEPYVPSLEAVAGYAHDYLSSVFDEAKVRGEESLFEVALFGHCPIRETFSAYHYKPVPSSESMQMRMESYESLSAGDHIYLGSYKSAFEEALTIARLGPPKPGRPLSRAPKHVIEDFIRAEDKPEVGGDLQLWSAYSTGLFPRMLARPKTPGQPAAQFVYLGRVLPTQLLHLGIASVGMLGVA